VYLAHIHPPSDLLALAIKCTHSNAARRPTSSFVMRALCPAPPSASAEPGAP
jgi:hypothetical protein